MLLWNVHLGFTERQLGSGDGRIFTISTQQAKFHEARTTCRNEGKRIAAIKNRYNITRKIQIFMRLNNGKSNVHYPCNKIIYPSFLFLTGLDKTEREECKNFAKGWSSNQVNLHQLHCGMVQQ